MSSDPLNDNVHKDHRSRLRRRFHNEGLDNFEPHEKLELLLYYSIPREDTNPIAHRLIERFGSVGAVVEASEEELCEINGIGPYSAKFLKLIGEICERYVSNSFQEDQCPTVVRDVAKRCLREFSADEGDYYSAIFIDEFGIILGSEYIPDHPYGIGGPDAGVIISAAFKYRAPRILLIHNRVSSARPSKDDKEIMDSLSSVLMTINRELLDYLIITKKRSYIASKYFKNYYDDFLKF